MRKLFASLCTTFFIFLLFSTLFLLNLRVTLFSASQVKSVAREANMYDLVAGKLREGILTQAADQLNESSLFEVINEAISAQFLQRWSEAEIDRVFAAFENPPEKFTIHLPTEDVKREITRVIQEKYQVELGDDSLVVDATIQDPEFEIKGVGIQAMRALGKIDQIIGVLAILALMTLLVAFITPSDKPSARFTWIGLNVLMAGVVFGLYLAAVWYYEPRVITHFTNVLAVDDSKVLIGTKKVLAIMLHRQKLPLLVETISLLSAGGLLLGLGLASRGASVEVVRESQARHTTVTGDREGGTEGGKDGAGEDSKA